MVMMKQEIMEAINDNTCVIVCGETGCGKTTQVPQFLYEAGYGSNHFNVLGGVIGVTRPHHVAVLATAKRVAFELGLRLGKEVGFQVRHNRRIGDNCSIKFMTHGILLRELQRMTRVHSNRSCIEDQLDACFLLAGWVGEILLFKSCREKCI